MPQSGLFPSILPIRLILSPRPERKDRMNRISKSISLSQSGLFPLILPILLILSPCPERKDRMNRLHRLSKSMSQSPIGSFSVHPANPINPVSTPRKKRQDEQDA